VLALVTDGFVEWARAEEGGRGEMFGIERLRASLARHAGLASADLIRAVAGEAEAFAGAGAQEDDLTMVVIRRAGA
jgi:serine phosphatase RsbU (regulator of sigma subunit)